MGSPRDLLHWQFDFTWSLARLHLDVLADDDMHWTPAEPCWTVHRGDDGRWRPDWADTEPDPVPVPTIGWLTWHIIWWWGAAIDHAEGRTPPDRTAVFWPGDTTATLARLTELHTAWRAVLDRGTDTELDAPSAYPWPADTGLTLAHQAAWVNGELMKNIAEIGQLRLLRAATAA